VVGGWKRKTHEWLYNTVSGTGARRDSKGCTLYRRGQRGRSACPASCQGAAEPKGPPVEATWVPETDSGLTTTRVRIVPFAILDTRSEPVKVD
jgi:hypothetical protein